jgi:uncharacterized glyoxalase superfamily protein PhnB
MPSLRYEDLSEALEWLSRAFGLKEHLRWVDEDGTVIHAEMRIADAFVELFAGPPGSDRSTEGHGCHALVVLVDDVDGHYRRARKAGALVIAEPEDKPWGLRQYTAQDPGGHRWEFSQHLRDVPPAEWGAQLIE